MGSAEKYPWFALYVADWCDSTAVMTDEQVGAYMRLLCHSWKEDGLPIDETSIRQLGRWNAAAWKRVWPAVASKWPIVNDKRRNPRQEIERAAAMKRRRVAQAKAGRRWDDAEADAGAYAGADAAASPGAVPVQCEVQVQEPVQQPQSVPERGVLSLPRAGALILHPKQLEATASGLYAAWNNVACAGTGLTPLEYDPPYSPSVHRALAAHPGIDWWAETFKAVAESDYLCGRVAGRDGTPFVASFWWVIDRIERSQRIHDRDYKNRHRIPKNAANLAAALEELA